ncbi:hypothetical protein [Sulfuracidifex tepidarius]|uniref:hypothetical protein n=1 Tax=Sulfuracidifex tepidarius TaxID=1294262 RepID=UPI000AEB3286|nr:hypothetical protein [Sulfuracidifex tepidarius]
MKKLFLEFLKFGGYPSVVGSNLKEKILLELYNDILTRDIVQACRGQTTGKIEELSSFYISNIGNRVSFRRISRSLDMPLRMVERFTSCISDSLLLYFVSPLSPSF